MYRDPGEDPISFGDIFEGEHLIDVYAAGDTRALGGGPMDRRAAKKIADQNSRDFTAPENQMVPLYTPAMTQHRDKNHALARGSNMKLDAPTRAILLADDCAADTALAVGRDGRRKRGRLLFAPVVPAPKADIERLTETQPFGRFPLGPCEAFVEGAVAELRYAFNVDVADIRAEDRILGLTPEAAEDLESTWAACTLRRGPLATLSNVERLADLIEAGREDAADHEGLAEAVGEVLEVGWLVESALDAAAEAPLTPNAIERLTEVMGRLEETAREAHKRLGDAVAK